MIKKILHNFISFEFIDWKSKFNFQLPESYNFKGLRIGHHIVGKVIGIGSKAKLLRVGEYILLNENSIINANDQIKNGERYFVRESEVIARLNRLPEGLIDHDLIVKQIYESV